MEFKLPDIGEGLEEGEIVKWLVKEGDVVKVDQDIVKIETDKAVADLPSPVSGRILKINFKEGDTVKVGETLCVIGKEGEKIKENVKEVVNIKELKNSVLKRSKGQTQRVLAAPTVRKIAKELKINLADVKGSGEGGRIIKKDIESMSPASEKRTEEIPQQKISVKKKYDEYGYIERIPIKGIRKTIAQNMVGSLSGSAQLTAMEDIDVTKLWKLREKEKKHFALEGVKLTFLPFIVKAVIAALKKSPFLNSSIEGEEIIVKKYFNVGIAVETEFGLMVPVIKIAERKSIAEIAKEIEELAEKARTRKIDIMDMKGGTFTITNYGSIGGTYATPILNPPETGILGLGRIQDRVLMNKAGFTSNRKILPVSLTFDHRVLDGAQAARFLESLKLFLEEPDNLFREL